MTRARNTATAAVLVAAVLMVNDARAASDDPPVTVSRGPDAVYFREPDVLYIPTPPEVVRKMLDLAQVRPGDLVYDLGCGDGRIVVEAARRGARRAVGVDIDGARVAEARVNAAIGGVQDRVELVEGDLFDVDLADATVVTLYLLPDLNLRLRPRLLALRPGTRIVSHAFSMGDWEPDRVERVGPHMVYFWIVPEHRAPVQARKGEP